VRQGVPLWYDSLSGDSSPLVVLVDSGSYPSVIEYLAPLQRSGRTVVVGETGAEPMRRSYTCPLPGALGFQLRLSVPWDGEGEVRLPVVEVSPSIEDLRSGRDVALETAVAILDDWEKRDALVQTISPLIGESLVEFPRSVESSLSREERLLGLFKLWSAIRYFYPFPEMIEGDWGDALREFIPRVDAAGDDRAYYYELQNMMARINDGHALLDAQLPAQYRPPIEIREIEGQAVITRIDQGQSLGSPDLANLEVGMIIDRVDGRPVMELIAESLVRIPSATDQHRRYLAFARLLVGQRSTDVRLEVASLPNEASRTVILSRTHSTLSSDPSSVSCWLEEGVGSIDLTRINKEGFEQAIGEFSSSEGLILDLRGYPSSVEIGMVLDYLTDDEVSICGWAHIPVVYSPDPRKRGWKMEAQRLESGSIDAYKGEVVILTNASAGSAPEWLLICLESTARVTIVGEATAGTTGDITFVEIPGPAYAGLTGMKVLHADGRPFQGIGIIPDVEVHPTIQGIREGRDEILEKGREVLRELIAQRKGSD
jgi:C-terminal processing protease CtpA/Prc